MKKGTVETIKKGTYKIIHIDGTESVVEGKPSIDKAKHIIGCETIDAVNLGNDIVMLVDDTGMVDGRPINLKATDLMLKRFGAQYPHKIHGDVLIVNDLDFA